MAALLSATVVAALLARGPPQGHLAQARLGSPAGMARGLRDEAAAVAAALAGATNLPVRALLCGHGWPWPAAGWPVSEVQVTTPRRLADAVRGGSRVRGEVVDQATARALEVLRPAE
jgi:hypothetical protein